MTDKEIKYEAPCLEIIDCVCPRALCDSIGASIAPLQEEEYNW